MTCAARPSDLGEHRPLPIGHCLNRHFLCCKRRKAVSFHAVSFGLESSSMYLRRMAEIARDAQDNAPRDPLAPAAATVLSSYTQALDTVRWCALCFVVPSSRVC